MFDQKHINRIEEVLEENISDILKERIVNLKKDYEKNAFIESASVTLMGEKVAIKLDLTFEPVDAEEQNIPSVFEYGGVIFREGDGEKEMVEIQPGFYIRRNLVNATAT